VEGGLWLLAVIVIVAHIAVLARLARRGEQQTETSRRLFEMLHRQLLLPKRFGFWRCPGRRKFPLLPGKE